jgi:hypothetical protein
VNQKREQTQYHGEDDVVAVVNHDWNALKDVKENENEF